MRYRSVSTWHQVMACCLTAPIHYQGQCRLITAGALRHSPKSDLTSVTCANIILLKSLSHPPMSKPNKGDDMAGRKATRIKPCAYHTWFSVRQLNTSFKNRIVKPIVKLSEHTLIKPWKIYQHFVSTEKKHYENLSDMALKKLYMILSKGILLIS